MHLALAIYRYFPYGGLQRDMLRIAHAACASGHQVTVFCTSWEGERPADLAIKIIRPRGWGNHRRMCNFGVDFLKLSKELWPRAITFTFNRFPGADFYFAGDNSVAVEFVKKHSRLMIMLNPRYWCFLRLERELFAPRSPTKVFYITPRQKTDYMREYGTAAERFFFLPPGIDEECRRPADAEERRSRKRHELGLSDDGLMLILVGSDFRRKGGDRAIRALAALNDSLRRRCRLFLVGQASAKECLALASALAISDRVICLGGRNDVPDLLLAADLMVHPARDEAAGTVLIEALAAGLPVLCTEECGFSNYIRESGNAVVPWGAGQDVLDVALGQTLEALPELRRNTLRYAADADFYRRADIAVDCLESFAEKDNRFRDDNQRFLC